jgi:hypothetical protein
MTVHAATADQLERLAELVTRKFGDLMSDIFQAHLRNDVISFEQADHEIADLSALPNRSSL